MKCFVIVTIVISLSEALYIIKNIEKPTETIEKVCLTNFLEIFDENC